MVLSKYKACICEGAAEAAIMDILIDNNLLIFTREEMLDEEVIRCRDARKFEETYLRKGFSDKIPIIRILDSKTWRNSVFCFFCNTEEIYDPEPYDIPFEGVDEQCIVRQIKLKKKHVKCTSFILGFSISNLSFIVTAQVV